MAEGTKDALGWPSDFRPCHHQLKRPPDLVTDGEGVSYLLFECFLCGCGIGLQLGSGGEINGEFILPPEQKCA
jgi:hypothetical protein